MKRENSGSDSIEVRKFEIEDYEEVVRLWDSVGLPYKPHGRDRRQKILKEIRQPSAFFYVADDGVNIIASILGTHDGRKGWINRLAVLPEYRQRGIARLLVEKVERELHDRGIDIVACLIEDGNTASMEFFEHIGYEKHSDIIYFTRRRYEDI